MFSIVVFLSIFSIQIYTEETFDCTGYDDDSFHLMSNTDDCRFYWHCIFVNTVYMQAVKRVCPVGTEFDIRLNQCEWTGLVNCVSRKSSEILTSTQKETVRTTSTSPEAKVLPNNSSQLLSIFFIEQLLRNLTAMKLQLTTTHPTLISTSITSPPSRLKRRHLIHRENLTLNILISTERKIRRFHLYQTHGLLIHCNEIRRRRLRELIFRTPNTTIQNISSSKVLQSNIFSLTILLLLLLHFTKISD